MLNSIFPGKRRIIDEVSDASRKSWQRHVKLFLCQEISKHNHGSSLVNAASSTSIEMVKTMQIIAWLEGVSQDHKTSVHLFKMQKNSATTWEFVQGYSHAKWH